MFSKLTKSTLVLPIAILGGPIGPFLFGQAASPGDPNFKGKLGFTMQDSVEDWPKDPRPPAGAPNVVVVLLDDVGYGATDLFGGPVPTPELDRLAACGLRYNNFHTTAYCAPSRAALLSGRNDHRVGFGVITGTTQGFPGYNGIWKKNTVPVAEVLRRNGYSTAAFGKWHNTPTWETTPVGPFDRWPTSLGFEYFYGFLGAQTDQWHPTLYRNTLSVEPPKTPEQGYILTTDLADEAVHWLHVHQARAPDKPYFLYFATGATHEPHHAPKEWIEKYRGKFAQGYDQLREEIFARQKKLGVIPANAELSPRAQELPAWNSFSADEKKFMAREMEVYAAYLAHADYEVGRVLRAAQEGTNGDNTLIIYIAGDNGASAEGGFTGKEGPPATMEDRLKKIDDLGSPAIKGSNLYASGWAYAMCAPFPWAKRIASHFGGTTVPLIVSWPARIKDRGGLRGQFGHLNDVAATLYEVTGIPFPESVDGVKQVPLDGTSLAYSFDHPDAPATHRLQIFEQSGNRSIYQDGWVAAARHGYPWDTPLADDFAKDRWQLYHVADDFSEAHDVAAQYPEKLQELQALFDGEARANDIYPLMRRTNSSRPSPDATRKEFIYYPDVADLVMPDFRQSYRITADVVMPAAGAEGSIVSSTRGDGSGFALYVENEHLTYEISPAGKDRMKVTSREVMPRGRVVIGFEFVRDAGESVPAGSGRLYVNDQLVGEAKLSGFVGPGVPRLGALVYGQPARGNIAPSVGPTKKFTGELGRLRVELK